MQRKLKICFVNGANPNFLGGISLYSKNFIKFLDKNKFEITWIYKGNKNKIYSKEGIKYIELKITKKPIIEEFCFNKKVKKILDKEYFDIINSHAVWGSWMKNYSKKENQKIIHTYHGVTYYFFKNHLKRFKGLKRYLTKLLLLYSKIIERPPIKKADKIICVSEKVKDQIEKLYGKNKKLTVIRTGVDNKEFKSMSREVARKKVSLEKKGIYGLYVGRGGFWTKGLDRAVNLARELNKLNKNFKLIVIGPDKGKVGNLLSESFIISPKSVPRELVPTYYSSSDILFCMSRYEGGAPTLVVSEGMQSGCLVVCSKDSNQEIINDSKNGIIIDHFNSEDAKKILKILKDKNKLKMIIKNSKKEIKNLSLEKWGKEYLKTLIK